MKEILSCFRIASLAALLAMIATARSATNGFVIPTFRGAANSQSGYWENFTAATGAPGNLPDRPGATTSAVLTQTNPAGLVTGSGNLYCTDIAAFQLADAVPFTLGTVALQTRSLGSELDYPGVVLVYTNNLGVQAVAPLFRYELSRVPVPGLGEGVSSLWQWDLTGLGVTNYTLFFRAVGAHTSFDSLTLDTAESFAPVFTGQPFALRSLPADLSRWMYPFNASPGSRPAASVFGSFGSAGAFDTRDAQFFLGWSTTNCISAGQGAKNYLVRRARVTLTIASGSQYVYRGMLRDYRTYFHASDPRHIVPASNTSPVELFGVGYRGGWTAQSFRQDTAFYAVPGGGNYTNRTAFAAGFDTNGVLVDVSNNVGDDGTNEVAWAFEVAPFAVGQTTNVAEGQLMPLGSKLTFDLNLNDPLIYGYLQNSLNDGKLNFMVSTLLASSLGGTPNYPNFYTIFSSIAGPDEFPQLEIEGSLVRTNIDLDVDGLPDDWQNFHFGRLGAGAANSFAADGVSNYAKYVAGTSPTNSADNLRIQALSGNQLKFSAAPNRQYAVQFTTNLQTWETVTNPALIYSSAWLDKSPEGVVYPAPVYAAWRDTNAAGSRQFYRLTVQ